MYGKMKGVEDEEEEDEDKKMKKESVDEEAFRRTRI